MLELVGVCKTEESDRKVPQAEAKTPSVVRVTEESPLLPGTKLTRCKFVAV